MKEKGKKPALTGPHTNQLAKALLGNAQEHERKALLRADWRAFIRQEFHLNKVQNEHIQNLPAHTVERIQVALNQFSQQGGHLELTLPNENPDGRGKLIIHIGETTDVRYTVPVLYCTFDSNCQNWDCNPLS